MIGMPTIVIGSFGPSHILYNYINETTFNHSLDMQVIHISCQIIFVNPGTQKTIQSSNSFQIYKADLEGQGSLVNYLYI
jgi:hypothetical protein